MFDYYVDESGEWDYWHSRYFLFNTSYVKYYCQGIFANAIFNMLTPCTVSLLINVFVYSVLRVPEMSYFDAADLLGECFVDTIDTVSPHSLDNYAVNNTLENMSIFLCSLSDK